MPDRMNGNNEFEYLIFDLDNTLYSPKNSILRYVDSLINEFMKERFGLEMHIVDSLRKFYRDKYGTTLNGLMKHYNVQPMDYLEYVHSINYEKLIKRDERLQSVLKQFKETKIVFTNGSKKHAENVLKSLGVFNLFDAIYSIEDTDFHPKPFEKSFDNFLKKSGVKADKSIFFEDMEVNLKGAKNFGFKTALVWKENDEFDYSFSTIYDIIKLA